MEISGNRLKIGDLKTERSAELSGLQRATHLYVCGSTGTGKSKFLEHLLRQDILNWRSSKCGLLLIDPHGSLYDGLMEWMAFHDLERPIVPIDLRRDDRVTAYNMLRARPEADSSVVAANFVLAMAYVWGSEGTDSTPLFAKWGTQILRTLYETKQTLVEAEYLIDHIAVDVRRLLASQATSQSVRNMWKSVEDLTPSAFRAELGSTVNRLQRFLGTDMLRSMFGQSEVSLDLGNALEEGQIVLVNLAPKGLRISDEDASLFATLLLSDLWAAARERGKGDHINPPKQFYVYIDEFQNFVTPSIAQGLDQARGFGLHLTLAHQYPNQLLNAGPHGKAIYDSVIVNARSKVVFQMEGEDNLRPLASALFMGVMDPEEVKLELRSTKVMDYTSEERISVTRSATTTESDSEGSGEMELPDDSSDPGKVTRVSSNTSVSRGRSEGYSETRSRVDVPVLGKEISSVQFRDLEEQKFRAMKALFSQPQRTCIARLAGDTKPVSLKVPEVRSYHVKKERVKAYADKAAAKWPFMLSTEDARQRLKARNDALIAASVPQRDEPKSAKRMV